MWVAVNLTCHHFIMVSCWIYVIFDTKKIRIPLKKRSLLSNGGKKLSSAQWRSSLYSVKLFHIFHIENAEKNVQFLHENDLCPCRLKLLHNTIQCNQVVVQSSHALLLSGTRLESITTGNKHTQHKHIQSKIHLWIISNEYEQFVELQNIRALNPEDWHPKYSLMASFYSIQLNWFEFRIAGDDACMCVCNGRKFMLFASVTIIQFS